MVAGTQKVLFLCNCCSTTLVPSLNDQSYCSGTTGRAKKAEPLPWCYRGRWMEAQWSPQWSLNGPHWSAKGGTMVVQIWKADVSLKLIHNVSIFYWATNGHSATTAMCVPSFCLLWATCEPQTSSATFVRLFWTCSKLHGDHGVHGDVWTSYMPPLNDQGNCSPSLLPWTATWPVLWSHKGGTKVAAPV